MIFDLDGTLVQTEKLKAQSYARAAIELCPRVIKEFEVIEAFKDVVGLSRRDVATALLDRFDLSDNAEKRMIEYGVSSPWQAFVQVRLKIYQEMLADPNVILNHQWPHNISLLEQARKNNCQIGLATMSYCQQVTRVLAILELGDAFNFIATRDDVEQGKPEQAEGFIEKIPKRRIGKPEDIAAAILFVSSDDADYIHGTTLFVDGGMIRTRG